MEGTSDLNTDDLLSEEGEETGSFPKLRVSGVGG
jgi:hypothetical protein